MRKFPVKQDEAVRYVIHVKLNLDRSFLTMFERNKKNKKDFEELVSLDDTERLQKEFDLQRYRKLESVVRLRNAGLPTLPGFAVKKLSGPVVKQLGEWSEGLGAKRLSLRFDSPNPEDAKRLSISNPTLRELPGLSKLVKPPVIGIVLSENDRFNQEHSVVTIFDKERLRCEVVGSGFDAADLTRGQSRPHEVIEIYQKEPGSNDELSPIDIKEHQIISKKDYELSRKVRYGVIYQTLEKGLGYDVSSKELSGIQTERVEEFLGRRSTAIPEDYQPIGYERLSKVYGYLRPLDSFKRYFKHKFNIDVEGRVLSSSFLKKHGLVFWDLYGHDKYNKR